MHGAPDTTRNQQPYDENTARAHARATFPAIQPDLRLAADIRRWQAGLA